MVTKIIWRFFYISVFCLYFFIILIPRVEAASISLSSDQSQISSNDEFLVNVALSISHQPDGTQYYLRGVFYKSNTTKYCGYTWNNSTWFSGPYSSGDGHKNFLPMIVQSASWSGILKAKLDTTDADCQDTATYKFKIQRFTESGSGSFDDQNILDILINVPIPTPTPTIIPTATPTFNPTPTKSPTNTPVPTSTPTFTPTPTSASTPTPTPTHASIVPTPTSEATSSREQILGITDSLSPIPTDAPPDNRDTIKPLVLSLLFVALGLAILMGLFIWNKRSAIHSQKEDIL